MQDDNLQDLQEHTFVIVVAVTVGLAISLLYILLAVLEEELFQLGNFWWLPPVLILLTCYFSYILYKKDRYQLGAYVFIGGLVISTTSFFFWPYTPFAHPHQIYLLILIVALAGMLISPQATAQAAAFAIVVTIGGAIISSGDISWAIIRPLIAPLIMSCAMAAISWISSDHLITTVQWAMSNQRRADERSRELFDSQQELQKAYLMLEMANKRLKEAESTATRANELKTRFITNLSHELRTPLSAIINFSYILSQNYHGPVTKEQQDYLMRVHDSGELLLEIVNDLLDLAKVESGQIELFLEPIDVTALGDSVLSTISGLIANKSIELRQDIPADLPLVEGDETRVRQVLLNLLGNAAKYTNKGSITLRMAKNKNQFVQISIIDTGIGIKQEDFKIIFEEFRQTKESFALRKQGTGLGLPISKKFVELHRGKLWVESKLGQGSTFHFTLPITPDLQTVPEHIKHLVNIIDS